MEKLSRKIFQPDRLTNLLLDGACGKDKINLSDFMNAAITEYFTPLNDKLKSESDFIFTKIRNQDKMSTKELKSTLARCVSILKDYPISDPKALKQIFIHFTRKDGRVLRYDYIQIVDNLQDEQLHRLNDIIKTVDSDYNLGTREFGERSRYVFSHWEELYRYSEIYIELATLIDCEDIYYPLDVFRTIDLIKWLDLAISKSPNIVPIKEPFPTNISNEVRYYGIRYEIAMYYTDNGYSVLSGDSHFKNIPSEIQAYFQKFLGTRCSYANKTDGDIKTIAALEAEGRLLFKRLTSSSK